MSALGRIADETAAGQIRVKNGQHRSFLVSSKVIVAFEDTRAETYVRLPKRHVGDGEAALN